MGLSNLNGRGFSPTKYFGYLNTTKNYLKFLSGQGVAWPDYATRNQWDNFFRYIAPNIGPVPRNLTAYYNIQDLSSMLNNAGNVPGNGDSIKLIADRSGNSATNCLVLNGSSGNYASSPDSAALDITGDIDIRVDVAFPSYSTGSYQSLITKGASVSYDLYVEGTGKLQLNIKPAGSGLTAFSTVTLGSAGISAFGRAQIRATYSTSSGNVNFYYRTDGNISTSAGWNQLGATVSTAGGAITATSNAVEIGARASGTALLATGNFFRAQIFNGIAGTLAFDANFATASKLATSFTESSVNAATVTINTSGDLGARISGERDLVQLTNSKQPILTVAGAAAGGNFVTFDGSNDFVQSASFALAQPITDYLAMSQVSWTNQDTIIDGGSTGARVVMQQYNASPYLGVFKRSTGTSTQLNNDLAVGARGIVTFQPNGASTGIRVNRGTMQTGDGGTDNPNGICIGAFVGGGFNANITLSELAIYSENHSTAVQDLIISALSSKYSIPL